MRLTLTAFGLAVFLISTSLSAEELDAETATWFCDLMGEYGEAIMEVRQSGASMSDVMALSGGLLPEDAGELGAVLETSIRKMIIAAYERSHMSSKSNQIKSVSDFSNEIQLACYKKYLKP